MRFRLLIVLALVFFVLTTVKASERTLLLKSPTISNTQVAFVYAQDIWLAERDGQHPRRLTVHEGAETNPKFSPDGTMLAFTASYDGNTDVYVMSVNGGSPERLTFHPSPDIVEGWTPDGQSVLFRSTRSSWTPRYNRLHTIPLSGGFPVVLDMPYAEHGDFSPDGKTIAHTIFRDPFRTWKHYRGGLTARIWLSDSESLDYIEIPRDNSNDTSPTWFGGKLYFLSDRNWTMNVFSFNPDNEEVKQITQFDDYDVKSLSAGPDALVIGQGGMISLLDPDSGQLSPLDIWINPDLPSTRKRLVDVSKSIRSFGISPTGTRGIFVARGDVFTVPAKKGDTRNLTRTSDVHDRSSVWSPDGSKIAWFSDKGGEYKLAISDQFGKDEVRYKTLGNTGFYFKPRWSPDSKKILYRDAGINLYVIDVESGKSTLVDHNDIEDYGKRVTTIE